MKKYEYKIISNNLLKVFEMDVITYLNCGWTCVGGVCRSMGNEAFDKTSIYSQAMQRKWEENGKNRSKSNNENTSYIR